MDITVRLPNECSVLEREAFIALVSEGAEVPANFLQNGIQRARELLWIASDNQLSAVAAIKIPLASYRFNTFKKAKAPDQAVRFPIELGYIYVASDHRGKGYATALVKCAINLAGTESMLATTRVDNTAMQVILSKAEFAQLGSDYASQEDASRLLRLYVREGART
jgi:RimJ/RimL family protein N-acetyltransferase